MLAPHRPITSICRSSFSQWRWFFTNDSSSIVLLICSYSTDSLEQWAKLSTRQVLYDLSSMRKSGFTFYAGGWYVCSSLCPKLIYLLCTTGRRSYTVQFEQTILYLIKTSHRPSPIINQWKLMQIFFELVNSTADYCHATVLNVFPILINRWPTYCFAKKKWTRVCKVPSFV